MPCNFVSEGSQKKLCSRLSSSEVRFYTVNCRFGFLSLLSPLWGLRSNVRCSSSAHWKARRGLSISVNWTFFASCYGWGVRATIYWKSAFSLQRGQFDPEFQVEGINHSSCRQTNAQNFPSFFHNPRVWQTDRQTDSFLVDRPRCKH